MSAFRVAGLSYLENGLADGRPVLIEAEAAIWRPSLATATTEQRYKESLFVYEQHPATTTIGFALTAPAIRFVGAEGVAGRPDLHAMPASKVQGGTPAR